MMMYIRPFQGKGATVNIAVTAASQALAVTRPGVGTQSIRIANVGTDVIFVAVGVAATTVTAANGIPILPNSTEVLLLPNDATHVAVIAGATNSVMYVTTGESA